MQIDRNSFLAGLVAGLALSFIVMSVVVLLAPRSQLASNTSPPGSPAVAQPADETASPSPAPSRVARPAETQTVARLATPTPSSTATPTQTQRPSPTSTDTPQPTATPSRTRTPTETPTETPTKIPTETPTPAPTICPGCPGIAGPLHQQSISVPPRAFALIRVPTEAGQVLEVSITLKKDIDLILTDPEGIMVVGPVRVKRSFSVQRSSPVAGDWVIKLDNSFSIVSTKDVNVKYRIYSLN